MRFISAVTAALALSLTAAAQSPVDISAWDDAASWPEMPPGKLGAAVGSVPDMRLIMDAAFGTRGQSTAMIIDTTRVSFQDRPALWVQFLSRGTAGPPTNNTMALDAIAIDRTSAQALFRIMSAPGRGGPQRGAGSYLVVHYGADGPVTIRADEDGGTDVTRAAGGPVAEFATLGFVLHGLDLEAGMRFRVPGYTAPLNLLTQMPLRVIGEVAFENAAGTTSKVWAVDLLSVNRATVIRFHVTRDAPFFHGWEYRRVADGVVVSRFVLRDWQDLTASRSPRSPAPRAGG